MQDTPNNQLDIARELYEKAIRFSTINTSKSNLSSAIRLFKSAAKLGHIQSSYIIGEAYCKGKWERDITEEESLNFLLFAAKKNHTEAMVVFGDLHHKSGRMFDAMNEYMLALSHGSPTALQKICGLIDNPIGKHYITNLFKREQEEKTDGNLQFYIATCYLRGLGLEKDLKRAHGWLLEAAKNNNAFALHGLGQMYEHGVIVEADRATASDFYLKAGQHGFSKGYVSFAMLEVQKITEMQKAKPDYSQVICYLTKAMEIGDCFASNELGNIYAQGLSIGFPEYSEALNFFHHAADLGNPDAIVNLANLYYSMRGSDPCNLMKAETYFSSLLTHDEEFSKIAYYGIGRIKEKSISKKSRRLARGYITKSAKMGFAPAQQYIKSL